MKKNIVIIGTYPAEGSKNIGDWLITKALCDLISEFGDFDFSIVWRADHWESVKEKVLSADHVFIACLAIRPEMADNEYPYLRKLIDSGVPFSVISAGTNLKINGSGNIFNYIGGESKILLGSINDNAVVCTTRGVLTQELCDWVGLERFRFSGDVAFFNKDYMGRSFIAGREIKKIVISDPHRPKDYIDSFKRLCLGLIDLFPDSEIVVAQHGINFEVNRLCGYLNLNTVKIYEDPEAGLRVYDDADLHVGFRVHAHVSALSRRKYSYLLEQDGRGCDYGLTLERKLSVPNYRLSGVHQAIARLFSWLGVGKFALNAVSTAPAEEMIAMIRYDWKHEFRKFVGLEEQIDGFVRELRSAIKNSLSG